MNSFLERMREDLCGATIPKTPSDPTYGSLGAFKHNAVSDWIISGRMTCEAITRTCLKSGRTVVQHVAAIRFLYAKTLKPRDMKEDLPYPRNYRRRLPVVLSPEEAMRLIDSARNSARNYWRHCACIGAG